MRLYFGAMAVLFIAGGTWLLVRRLRVAARGVTVTGRVVAHESRRDDDGAVCYLPIVAFTDRQGAEHRFTSVAGGSEPRPAVGAAVAVRYLATSPDTAFIVSFLHMWAAPLAMFVLGTAALIGYLKD